MSNSAYKRPLSSRVGLHGVKTVDFEIKDLGVNSVLVNLEVFGAADPELGESVGVFIDMDTADLEDIAARFKNAAIDLMKIAAKRFVDSAVETVEDEISAALTNSEL